MDLQKKWSFQKTIIQISPIDYYIGGQYLEPGEYTVKKEYALGDDTVIVEADLEEITILLDGDAHLFLNVTSDPASEEAWLAMMETYTLPDLPTDVTVPDESRDASATETASTIDTAPSEMGDKAPEPEQEEIIVEEVSIVKTILRLMKSLAITALFGTVFYFTVEFIRKRQEESYYGAPMTVVLYQDSHGSTIPKDFLYKLDPLPKIRVENAPQKKEKAEQAKESVDKLFASVEKERGRQASAPARTIMPQRQR